MSRRPTDIFVDSEHPEEKPPLSAGQLKRLSKPAKPKREAVGPVPEGPRDDHFTCAGCGHHTTLANLGRVSGLQNQIRTCLACDTRSATLCDPAWRASNGTKRNTLTFGKAKTIAKRYRIGARLPKWMFS